MSLRQPRFRRDDPLRGDVLADVRLSATSHSQNTFRGTPDAHREASRPRGRRIERPHAHRREAPLEVPSGPSAGWTVLRGYRSQGARSWRDSWRSV
jgi:hypothetical protein